MKITVTEDHIKNGHKVNPDHCPVALALNDAIPEYKHAVGNDRYTIWKLSDNGNDRLSLVGTKLLPHNAVMFISDFDCGKNHAKSFEFEIEDI